MCKHGSVPGRISIGTEEDDALRKRMDGDKAIDAARVREDKERNNHHFPVPMFAQDMQRKPSEDRTVQWMEM